MQFEKENNRFKVIYRLYEGSDCHPESLDTLNDEAIDDLIEQNHEKGIERLASALSPHLLLAIGHILYIGYDAEWVEIKDGDGCIFKVLSYQFYIIGVGGEISAVFFPASTEVGARLDLQEMLAELLYQALKCGIIVDYPENIVLVGFFLRADLAMLADLIEFMNELGNVGGKIATTGKPVTMALVCKRRDYERLDNNRRMPFGNRDTTSLSQISFYDIAKHAPEKTPLSVLGELLKLPKLAIPEGYSISCMDKLLAEKPDVFLDYGITDAEITIKYYLHVLTFARKQIGGKSIDKGFLPVSAGAMAVKMCRKKMKESGFKYEEVFGITSETRQDWNGSKNRPHTICREVKSGDRQFHENFIILCYHGGRNECYYFGPTLLARWLDLDLVGAYSIAMLVIRLIDYAASFETRDLQLFKGDVMGFAWVDFKFPTDIRFPCLPVRTDLHGLQFPLEGTSHCTAPELALAMKMGAKITIRRGVVYPWFNSDQRPLQPFVQEVRRLRNFYPKGSLSEQYAKLLGNSLYGKTGQGLRGKTVFDTSTLQSMKVPESAFSCAPMAAHITGFIRAVMGEIMHSIPNNRTVVSCTTDGILTDCTESELDLSGELSQRFLSLIERV